MEVEESGSSWLGRVNRFCYQCLQLEQVLDYPEGEILRRPEAQDVIFHNVFSDETVRYGPPARYRVKVLKELVKRIEASIEDWDQHDISEDLMGTLSELLATPLLPETTAAQKKNYVTYHLSLLPGVPSITLLESRNLISASGTTGLRTWEAGLHLGQYLCRNPETVRGRRVLELGAGTGYLSVLCAAHLGAEHVVASDGSDDVIHNLPESFFLNGLQGSPRVTPMEVRWGHALVGTEDEAWNAGRPVDVVIGADVTYDSRVIPALVATIVDVLALHPRAEVYISAAHRSDETFGTFVGACHQQALDVEDLSTVIPLRALQGGPFYDDQVPMHVCKVSKSAGP